LPFVGDTAASTGTSVRRLWHARGWLDRRSNIAADVVTECLDLRADQAALDLANFFANRATYCFASERRRSRLA
jgi:hypothetical protein